MSPLPSRILLVKTCIWISCSEALRLIRERRAREVYDQGKFIGIELHALPVADGPGLLPPAELPGLHFEDPNPERKYASLHWSYV